MRQRDIVGLISKPQDRIIGKRVFKVRGLIPATNFIRAPRSKTQSLGLTGRFLYMQVSAWVWRGNGVHCVCAQLCLSEENKRCMCCPPFSDCTCLVAPRHADVDGA
jgi:hypothetical protein